MERPAPPRTSTDELRRVATFASARTHELLEIGLAIGSAIDLDALLEVVLEHSTALFAAERSTLFLLDASRQLIWSKVLQGGGLREIRLPLGEGIAGTVVSTGKGLNIKDPYSDRRFRPDFDRQSGFVTRSILCAPVLDAHGKPAGCVQVLNRRDGKPFDSEDEQVLAAVCAQISTALEKARLLEAERRKVAELDLLFGLSHELWGLPPQPALACALDRAAAACGARGGHANFRPREGEPVEVGHAQVPAGATSCRVPIESDRQRLGELGLFRTDGVPFSPDQARLLSLIAGQLGGHLLREQLRSDQERDQRLRLLGQTLGSLLHDLRSPLSVIQAYTELLAFEESAPKRRTLSGDVQKQISNLEAMTREVMAFVRGDTALLPTTVHIDRFLAEIREMLSREFAGRGIALAVEVPKSFKLRVDEGKLQRAVFNIARNAAEAMPDGGSFTLRAVRSGERAILSFTDTGRGIPAAVRHRLFEPFATCGKPEGTGLGLALVKQVVEAHRGQVRFESEPARGTTFFLEFPAPD